MDMIQFLEVVAQELHLCGLDRKTAGKVARDKLLAYSFSHDCTTIQPRDLVLAIMNHQI